MVSMEHKPVIESKQKKEMLKNCIQLPDDLKKKIQWYIVQNAITFLAHQPIILPTDNGRSLKIINGQEQIVQGQSTDQCYSVLGIEDNKLIIRTIPNMIKTWDLMSGQLIAEKKITNFIPIKNTCYHIIYDNKIAKISITPPFNKIEVWNEETNTLLHTFNEQDCIRVNGVTLDENRIAIALHSGTVHVKDIYTGNIINTLPGNNKINSVAIRDNIVIIGTETNTIIWDIKTNTTKNLDIKIYAAALCKNKLVTHEHDNTLSVWNLDNYTVLQTFKTYYFQRSNLTMNDNWIVNTTHKSCDIQAWPLAPLQGTTKENPRLWIAHEANILQGNLIRRACQATIDENEFILRRPKKFGHIADDETREQMDCRIYFTLPALVRAYLRNCLNIVAKKDIPLSHAI
jgi:WD40 repeat protein